MSDPFDEIRRQQERLNDFLGPSRRAQEEILRVYAPMLELEGQMRAVTDSLVLKGVAEDVLRAWKMIGQTELADFRHVESLLAAHRDALKVAEAVRQQSRWIEEAIRPITDATESLSRQGALAAVEKLVASKAALLDEQRWLSPRPVSLALVDVLYAGRTVWALSCAGTNADATVLDQIARVSESVIEALAAEGGDEVIDVPPEAASAGAQSVAITLSERTPVGGDLRDSSAVGKVDEAASFRAVKTIAGVIRYVETNAAKPLLGGFGGWAMAAGLEIVDPGRSAEDRFDSAVSILHDVFVDGVRRADATLAFALPSFFKRSVYDLRNKSTAHTVEAAYSAERIATNLRERRRAFETLCGGVPATEEEWAEALRILLRKAAEAAVEFRDAIARGELSPRVPRAHA